MEVDDGNRYRFVWVDIRMVVCGHDASGKRTEQPRWESRTAIFHNGIGRSHCHLRRNFVYRHVACCEADAGSEVSVCGCQRTRITVEVSNAVAYENGKLELIDIIRGPRESAPRIGSVFSR